MLDDLRDEHEFFNVEECVKKAEEYVLDALDCFNTVINYRTEGENGLMKARDILDMLADDDVEFVGDNRISPGQQERLQHISKWIECLKENYDLEMDEIVCNSWPKFVRSDYDLGPNNT